MFGRLNDGLDCCLVHWLVVLHLFDMSQCHHELNYFYLQNACAVNGINVFVPTDFSVFYRMKVMSYLCWHYAR